MIEVMACPGGCVVGGQPYPPKGVKVLDPELLRLCSQALYAIDKFSHDFEARSLIARQSPRLRST